MKKQIFGRQLSRERASRRALFRSLIRALVEHGKIETTKAKAKAVQGDVDGLVKMAKDGSVSAKRRAYAYLGNDKKTAKGLFGLAPIFSKRTSGFTRIVRLGRRRGDAAEMVRLEWVDQVTKEEKKTKKVRKKETKKK